MEKSIDQLEKYADKPTREMLKGIVKRKKKYDQYKVKTTRWLWLSFVLTLVYFYFAWIEIIQPSNNQLVEMFDLFFQTSNHLFYVLVIAACYATAIYYKKKEEKSEKEFHDLRCELIDKSTDLWNEPQLWSKRDEVYSFMKREFDINLYFENK
ncbi:DUF2663 family protein [Bacillus carboniphilus]|uniref:DUF2663 family protein n=1 Tax=Bacillus carboniphilus TaxID=86663 RepID=A0ABY9JWL0_9BACI|nr:DUF2663 family protein [Bacillus carboniphilus]WLR43764.1 DUF2663 family protein [Bacillus carboniphilus]